MFNNVDFDTYFKNYPDDNGYFKQVAKAMGDDVTVTSVTYGGAVLQPSSGSKKCLYDVGNAAILTLFIAFLPLIPQKISLVVVPLALNLLIRSVLHLAVARKKALQGT